MSFRILCLGDVVGEPGHRFLVKNLASIIETNEIDFCITNGENAANGSGINKRIFQQLKEAGVDVVTTGDHVWRVKEIIPIADSDPSFLRPANLSSKANGKGSGVFVSKNGIRIGVINIIGRVFMKEYNCPFQAVDAELRKMENKTDIIVVDIHAEATSEKLAIGRYLEDRVSLIYGTHTHIPTADAQLFSKKTAYITDIGMCGSHKSIIGRKIKPVLQNFVTGMPAPFEVADLDVRLSGIIVDFNSDTKQPESIKRFEYKDA